MRFFDWLFGPTRTPRRKPRRVTVQPPAKLRTASQWDVMSAINGAALDAADRLLDRAHSIQNLFTPGYNKGVSFQAAGAGAASTLAITKHSWEEEIDKVDITNTACGGVQALLATILRGRGNVEAFFDTAAMPFSAAPGIVAGAVGTMVFNVGAPNTQFVVPCMVIKLHHESEVAGGVKYNFDVELNCMAGVTQALVSYVRPT